jgi:sulfite reductase (NADPH) flavoprotein alpha-component
MLAPAKLEAVQQLLTQYSKEELLWISGYIAGVAGESSVAIGNGKLQQGSISSASQTITLLYATETGNSKKAATHTASKLKQQGIKTKLLATEQYNPEQLLKESYLVYAISTQGEGEPPAVAKVLFDFLQQSNPNLSHLRYSILALGSKSYPLFCQAGIDLNSLLKKAGATPFVPIAFCDDDYEPVSEAWTISLLDALQTSAKPAAVVNTVASKTDSKKIYQATVGTNLLLNDKGSNQQVHHLELDLPEEVLYNPGNAVGITPENEAQVVEKIISLLGLDPHEKVLYKQERFEAFELLLRKLSINHLTLGVIKKYAQLVQADIPDTRMDLYDLLRIYPLPTEIHAQSVIDLLNPITPRLYTISSAPNAHPGQLHLTVALHAFNSNGGFLSGFGSGYVTNLKPGQKVSFFLHQQKHFQIPRSDRHLIMIGQGTGIAPFRSMIAERDATGASGKNWLVFGEENFVTDFYYQSEIQGWVETGSLQHINLAFQKNRNKSLRVQDLLEQESQRLFQWLESGAYLFVSGEKDPMGKEVESQLQQIIAAKKGVSIEEAANYLKQMAKEGRYAKELY